jgi:hypothetical protein
VGRGVDGGRRRTCTVDGACREVVHQGAHGPAALLLLARPVVGRFAAGVGDGDGGGQPLQGEQRAGRRGRGRAVAVVAVVRPHGDGSVRRNVELKMPCKKPASVGGG